MRLEEVEYAYVDLLSAELPAALIAEAAYWAARTPPIPLPLPDIAEYHTGHIPLDVLFNYVQKPPAIIVECIAASPNQDDITDSATLMITVLTLGDDPAAANKLNHRYAHAIAAVINSYPGAVVMEVGRPTREIAQTVTVPERMAYIKAAQVSATVLVESE